MNISHHLFVVGQQVTYSDAVLHQKRYWEGGFEIQALLPDGPDEPQYRIRSADETHDRVAYQSQLQIDLSARDRGE